MPIAYIALGSNLGDREHHLRVALEHMGRCGRVARVSTFHETMPMGGPPDQGKYLNAAAALQTDLTPQVLLHRLLTLETEMGRVRTARFGPRVIDLDLLFFDAEVIQAPDLIVPHPRLHERPFVLDPLAEIAPRMVHPILQCTVEDLRQRLAGRELAGLKALVTGSTSGIGRAMVLELARGGADVVIHGRRARNQAEEVARECGDHQARAEVIMADLREGYQGIAMARAAWDLWGGLDIWVNNAGADTLTGDAAHWSFERKLAELWAVDVVATISLSRLVGGWMKERGRGIVLNMGWDQAESGMEGDSGQLFGTTKGAIMAFSRSLALSLAPQVRVNCLAPGWIRTGWGEQASTAWQERVKRETPLGRWGLPEDVAKAARWLVAPGTAYITGQIVRINGGAVRS